MLNRYRAAFEPRGSLSFSLAGLLGRFPASMVGLGLVFVIAAHGNYGRAGTLVGIQALSACVGGPLQGRLADRFGQARILVPVAATFGLVLAGLILALRADASFAVLAVLAAGAGASSPTTGTLARSRWTTLHSGGGRLQTAFAVEAVFDEVVFVVGPVLTTFLATYSDPLVALVVAAVAGVSGSLLLAAQHRTQPPSAASASPATSPATGPRVGRVRSGPDGAAPAARSPLPWSALVTLLVAQLTVGAIFGSTDVVTVAYATAAGAKQDAGLVLACFSGGSLLAGLVVGAVAWRMSPMRRVRICVAVLGCTTVLLPLVPNLRLLPLAGFAVGVTCSPALVAIAAAVQVVTPRDRLTEAMALGTSFLVAGFSLGSAVAGHLVDAVGPHRAYLQSAVAGLLATVVVLAPPAVRMVGAAVGRGRSRRSPRGPADHGRAEPVATLPAALPGPGGPGTTATRRPPTGSPTGPPTTGRGSAPGRGAPAAPRPPAGAAPTRSDRRGPGARRTNETARRR